MSQLSLLFTNYCDHEKILPSMGHAGLVWGGGGGSAWVVVWGWLCGVRVVVV